MGRQPVIAELKHEDGTKETIELNHTLNDGQIGWIKAGSGTGQARRGCAHTAGNGRGSQGP